MDLKMEIYSPFLELLGILEICKSVIWEEKAFTAGSFSIESLITEESMELLVPNNIVWIEGDTAGIIEYLHEEAGEDGPYIVAKGRTLTGILDYYMLWGQYEFRGSAPVIMRRLVDDCCVHPTRGDTENRKIPRLALLDAPTGGSSIRMQKTGGTLLEALEQLGEAYGVAFGVRFNPAVPQMEFWTQWGQNRSISQNENEPVFFSTELDDVLSSEYSYNAQGWKNLALVAGEGEGADRKMLVVEAEGEPAPPEPPTPGAKYIITLSIDPDGGGSAAGAGQYEEGAAVTLTATVNDGYTFTGWRENGQIVSTGNPYTFTAAGNRSLTAVFAEAKPSRLPEGYVELEWIEPTSGSLINTGSRVSYDKTRIFVDMQFGDEFSADRINICRGNNTGSGTNTNRFILFWNTASQIGLTSYTYSPLNYSVSPAGKRMTLDLDYYNGGSSGASVFYIDGEQKTGPAKSSYYKDPLYLFNNSTTSQAVNGKFFSVKIYQSGIIEHDFVPCKDPNGEVGLYDLETKSFYKNTGTTGLTAGPAA